MEEECYCESCVCITRGSSNDAATAEESCVGVETRTWLQRMEQRELVGGYLPTGGGREQMKHDDWLL